MTHGDSSQTEFIPNVLAERYPSPQMRKIWSPEYKVLLERNLWISVMNAQHDLGLTIPEGVIDAYEQSKHIIDVATIKEREKETRHDVKAALETFNTQAGHEYAHRGMTSRDLTDNVEQLQNRDALRIIRDHSVATLARFATRAAEYSNVVIPAKTHNVPAQPTLLGKRFAMTGEEMVQAFYRLEELLKRYPIRGIKGAVGTQTDQLQLFNGDEKKVMELEKRIAQYLEFDRVLTNVGQIYPRSLDLDVVSTLMQLAAAPSNFALNTRLMAGNGQMTEGFKEGQTGSTGMPHKQNARTCERINALENVLRGHLAMAAAVSGNQWYEGDVSDSATRRVFLTDSFMTMDGILESTMTVLDESGIYPAMVEKELNTYLPFLTSTRILMTAVKKGVGRETAHKVIKEHSVAAAKKMQSEGVTVDLLENLANDSRLGLTRKELDLALEDKTTFVGLAGAQINHFVSEVETIVQKYPEAAAYNPAPIL